jgi:hypothetical protein
VAQALQAAEKVFYFGIPSEARNLSVLECQRKRDSSARSAPRNDKIFSFSASCLACGVERRMIVSDGAENPQAEACATKNYNFVESG